MNWHMALVTLIYVASPCTLKEKKATIYVWSAGNIVFERKAAMAWREEGNDEVTGRNSTVEAEGRATRVDFGNDCQV